MSRGTTPDGSRASGRIRRSTEERGEPLAAALDGALLRRVVDVHEAEPAGVAPRPLEVVRERPDEVALERDPLVEGGRAGHHVLLEVPATVLVLDLAVDHRVRIGRAVLGDVQRKVRPVRVGELEDVEHALRVDGPAHLGAGRACVDELQTLAARAVSY